VATSSKKPPSPADNCAGLRRRPRPANQPERKSGTALEALSESDLPAMIVYWDHGAGAVGQATAVPISAARLRGELVVLPVRSIKL
jgi:hypothetical protein